jgi:hypothetical protein
VPVLLLDEAEEQRCSVGVEESRETGELHLDRDLEEVVKALCLGLGLLPVRT